MNTNREIERNTHVYVILPKSKYEMNMIASNEIFFIKFDHSTTVGKSTILTIYMIKIKFTI